ncbi:unnamed protein product, partial [Callosobruchus maculatus]
MIGDQCALWCHERTPSYAIADHFFNYFLQTVTSPTTPYRYACLRHWPPLLQLPVIVDHFFRSILGNLHKIQHGRHLQPSYTENWIAGLPNCPRTPFAILLL